MSTDLASKTATLVQELQGLTSLDQLGDDKRWQLSSLLDQVRKEVQPPMSFMQDLTQSSNVFATVRIAIAMGIFDTLAASRETPMTLEEINQETRGDRQLLVRILRLLAMNGFVGQIDHKWLIIPKGLMMTQGTAPSMMVIHYYSHLKSHANLLDYLRKRDFRNPDNYLDCPWQHAHKTELGYFEWMAAEEPIAQAAFNKVMTLTQLYRGQDWFEYFPVEERLAGSSSSDVLLVDIGGGLGHDAIAFRKAFSHLGGKVVLQDLAGVVGSIQEPVPSGLELQIHDAFKPQSIRGAKIYYMRTVLHDWPDIQAVGLLKNVGKAMSSKSILLVNENLMSTDQPSRITLDVDFIMMNGFGAMERTEQQWIDLFKAADFVLLKTWRSEQQLSPHALFELVPRHLSQDRDLSDQN